MYSLNPLASLFGGLVCSVLLFCIYTSFRLKGPGDMTIIPRNSTKTVVVLGGAYAGRRAATVLAQLLPKDWKLVVIERNTHFNREYERGPRLTLDAYVFPRYTVLSQHAPKAFIPYIHAFEPRKDEVIVPLPGHQPALGKNLEGHLGTRLQWIHGTALSLSSRSVTFKRISPSPIISEAVETLEFDYCIYALGATLPSPVDVWCKTMRGAPHGYKTEGVRFMEDRAEDFDKAKSVVIVGGGAMGIREHPTKLGLTTQSSQRISRTSIPTRTSL